MPAYNLVATLNLQSVDASQAISNLQKQLAATNFSINVTLNSANAVKQAGQLQQAFSQASTSVKALTTAQGQVQSSTNSLSQAQGGLVRQFVATHREAINTRREMSTFVRDVGSLTGSLLTLHRGLVMVEQAWASLQRFQKLSIQLSQIEGRPLASPANQAMEKQVRQTAIKQGVSSNDLMGQAVELSQAGFDDSKIKSMLDMLAHINLNEQIKDIKGVTDSIILLNQTFGQSGDQIEKSLSSILTSTKSYAITVSEINELMKKSGAVFHAYGADVNTLVAIGTSVREATRLNPSVISTGMNSSLMRIYAQPKARQEVERLGVNPYDSTGKQKDVLQTIVELSKAFAKLTDAEKNESAFKIAGARNQAVFLSMLSQSGNAVEIYNATVKAGNTLAKDAEIAQSGFASQLTKVKEAWLSLAASLTSNPVFTALAKTALELTASLTKLVPAMAMVGAMKLGGMASGIGAMGMGFPQTSFATGFNRFVQPMPNSDHEGFENPSLFARGRYALNRSGNAAIGGVANFARQNAGAWLWPVASLLTTLPMQWASLTELAGQQ